MHGSHLVVNANTTVSEVFADDTSMFHGLAESTIRLGRTLASNTAIYYGAILQFTDGSDITLDQDLDIKGKLAFDGLIKLTIAGNLVLQSQDLQIEELTVETEAKMTVVGNRTFNLGLTKFSVSGLFKANSIHFLETIEEFYVSSEGKVEFDPQSSEEYFGKIIQLNGIVDLKRHISIKYPCEMFSMDGTLSWPATGETITLECTVVVINGEWKPGNLSYPSGLDRLSIGPQGVFHFTAVGPILTDSFSVAGEVNIANVAEFKSKNVSNERIEVFIVHSSGSLKINTGKLPYIALDRDESKVETANHIRAVYLTVGGTLEANELTIGPGIDYITVEKKGVFTFQPVATFEVYKMKVNGVMKSTTSITLKGISDEQVHEVIVGPVGSLLFDNWSNASTFSVNSFYLYGEFHAGLLQNHFEGGDGWTTLDMNGTMTFDPQRDFLCNNLIVDGSIKVKNPVNILSDSSTGMYFVVKSRGSIVLDYSVHSSTDNDFRGPWALRSNITADQFVMESGSRFNTGSAKWVVKSAEIGGTLNSYSLDTVDIEYFRITSTGNVNFHYTTHIVGISMTTESSVDSKSVLNMAYEFSPTDLSSGSSDSFIEMSRNVTIGGELYVGSLRVNTDVLIISGSVTATGGGYLGGEGEGQYGYCLSLCYRL